MIGDILPETQKGFILFHAQFDKKNTIDEKKLFIMSGTGIIYPI